MEPTQQADVGIHSELYQVVESDLDDVTLNQEDNSICVNQPKSPPKTSDPPPAPPPRSPGGTLSRHYNPGLSLRSPHCYVDDRGGVRGD